MNDPAPPAPVEDAQAPGSAEAPEPAAADFGASLRAAREAAGMTVPTLASRLRLHVKQIEALERADLAALPSLIYVRGFVRSCARELKIDPLPLLDDINRRAGVLPGAPVAPSNGGFPLARLGDGSRPIIAISLVVLVVAGVVGTLWPRRATVSTPAVAPISAAPLAEPAPAVAEPPPGAAGPAEAGAGALPGTEPAHGPTVSTDKPGAIKPLAPRAADIAGPPEPEPAAPATAAVQPAPDTDALVLHVHAPSWVEVVQADGTSVFSQICPAGSVQTLHGVPPLRIVIGNAAAVDARYHGAPVDLNRYANVNGVARFTLQ
jgi:cytoskeleton protein RodZ